MLVDILTSLDPERPVLIAGATASGKSALALQVAHAQNRCVVNADALQVFDCWRILTARPSESDERRVPHKLYGHLGRAASYSVGQWLRDVSPLLSARPAPVIVGGTGLYFTALTEGLADIPATEPGVRARADALLRDGGCAALLADLDAATRARIDIDNPMRVQRAWEVLAQTGMGLAEWQDRDTGTPLLPPDHAHLLCLHAERDWLNDRIARRFDMMMQAGALDEARRNAPHWDPGLLSSRAIGAAELVAVVQGRMDESDAAERAKIASRQYAKRQRTWFRRRMAGWRGINAQELSARLMQHSEKSQ